VIHAAYRALARGHHPDVNSSARASIRIRQLNAAYQVLSDPQHRARYDLELTRGRRHDWAQALGTASRQPDAAVVPIRRVKTADTKMDRRPAVTAQVLLGLLAVAITAIFMLLIIWAALDDTSDITHVNVGTGIELHAQR
jgi:curved DNA-binding protein CbpA